MAGKHLPQPLTQQLTSNADSQSGAAFYFYLTGTTTPTPVYADAALTTPLSNPVVADGAGRMPNIYYDEEISYRLTIKSAVGGTTIRDIDPVSTAFFGALADLSNLAGDLAPGADSENKRLYATTSGYALSFGDPSVPTIDVRDVAELLYGPGNYSYRTATGTGADFGTGTDWGLVAAAGFDLLRPGRGNLYWPAGNYSIRTAIPASKQSGNIWLGDGEAKSQLFYDRDSQALFNFDGSGGYTGGGVHGFTVYLGQGQGKTNATMLNCVGDATYQPDSTSFYEIRATVEAYAGSGASYWYNGINIVGTARTSPQGVRDCNMSNVQIFKCWNSGAAFYNLVQWTLNNVGVYTPYTQTATASITNTDDDIVLSVANPLILPGMACRGSGIPPGARVLTVVGTAVKLDMACTATSGAASLSFTSGDEIFIGGGGTSTTNTTQAYFRGVYAAGELNLTNSRVVNINGFTCDIVRADASFDRYGLDGEPANGLVGSLGTTGAARLGAVRYKNGSIVT